ncbi:MAG TPA: substrate-binding domain-containing protein [Planctomycetota bacterium]|nr:substrate-binding domain-containing protein [Planctomycetota bacterium]
MTTTRREWMAGAAGLALAGCGKDSGPAPFTLAMMPKSLGNQYFISCRVGAERAAKELGIKMLWDAPAKPDASKQNEFIEAWITRGVDAIAVACENGEGIAESLRRARAKGIKVVTWDADSVADARDWFVNQATPEGIGTALMDEGARVLGGKGEFAIITATLTASNLNKWRAAIEKRLAEKYPDIKLAVTRPCDDQAEKARAETKTILSAHPNVKLILAICSPSVPAAAEAVKQSGRTDVKVVGLGLPNDNKPYLKEGFTDTVILWKTEDLGSLAVQAAYAAAKGSLKAGDPTFDVKGLGSFTLHGSDIILGDPFKFTKANVDQFNF